MSGALNVRSISALEEQRFALLAFASDCAEALRVVEDGIRRTEEWLMERLRHWQYEVEQWTQELADAYGSLAECEASGYTDEEGNYHPPSCGQEQQRVYRAEAALDNARDHLQRVQTAIRDLEEAVRTYAQHAARERSALDADIPSATRYLAEIVEKLDRLTTMTIPREFGLSATPPMTTGAIAAEVGHAVGAVVGGGIAAGAAALLARAERDTPEEAALRTRVAQERVADAEREAARAQARNARRASQPAPGPDNSALTGTGNIAQMPRQGGHPETAGAGEREPSPESIEGGTRGPERGG